MNVIRYGCPTAGTAEPDWASTMNNRCPVPTRFDPAVSGSVATSVLRGKVPRSRFTIALPFPEDLVQGWASSRFAPEETEPGGVPLARGGVCLCA